jgi:hypothetical protein
VKSYFSSINTTTELPPVGRNSNEKRLSPIALIKSITFSGMSEPIRGRIIIICSWFIIPKDELEELELVKTAVIAVNERPISTDMAAITLIASAVLETFFVMHFVYSLLMPMLKLILKLDI